MGNMAQINLLSATTCCIAGPVQPLTLVIADSKLVLQTGPGTLTRSLVQSEKAHASQASAKDASAEAAGWYCLESQIRRQLILHTCCTCQNPCCISCLGGSKSYTHTFLCSRTLHSQAYMSHLLHACLLHSAMCFCPFPRSSTCKCTSLGHTYVPAVYWCKLLCNFAGPDEDLQAVAADSTVSTAHVRLSDPILSVSPHVTHLFADHNQLRTVSVPDQHQHSLLGEPTGMSRQHSSSVPASLHQTTGQPPHTSPTALPASHSAHSMPSAQGLQHSISGHQAASAHGQAKAQRQLFASLSDHARPSRLGSDAAEQSTKADSLEAAQTGISQSPVEEESAESHQLSLTEVYSRQRLFVCKMCRNPVRGLLCEPSSVQRIDYYQGNDMPLASFLAATAPQKCPNLTCGDGVTAHLRTFLHNTGRVTLSVSQTPAGKELPGSDKGQVWFWARPLQVLHSHT